MASKYLTVEGPIRWARLYESNRDMEGFEGAYEECDGAYTVDVGLDEDNFQKLLDTGSMKASYHLKHKEPEEDGLRWIKFVRKHAAPWDWAGGPPKVTDDMDNPIDDMISNGSKAEVTVVVYDTKRKSIKGTRLEKVKVTDLQVYTPDEGPDVPF